VVLKSKNGSLLREEIRKGEMSLNEAYEIVYRQLDHVVDDMRQNNKTYKQAKNSFQREKQAEKQHEKFQRRQEAVQQNQLEYQSKTDGIAPEVSPSRQSEVSQASNVLQFAIGTNKTTKFIGALANDLPAGFLSSVQQAMKQYIPEGQLMLVSERLRLQQVVHENGLAYTDVLEAA
jgi:electron transfer flavoprotein alpha subunit